MTDEQMLEWLDHFPVESGAGQAALRIRELKATVQEQERQIAGMRNQIDHLSKGDLAHWRSEAVALKEQVRVLTDQDSMQWDLHKQQKGPTIDGQADRISRLEAIVPTPHEACQEKHNAE